MPQNKPQATIFSAQLAQLDKLLCASRPLWQNRSFECSTLPWADDFPKLAATVWQLDDDELDAIDACPVRLSECLLPSLREDLLAASITWPLALLQADAAKASPATSDIDFASQSRLDIEDIAHFSAHIKGRK